jgi:hypothetical protein
MTTQLMIPTPFSDLAELTENFAQRVDEQRLMLPHSEAMSDGEWVAFHVQLADGSPAFTGVGKVQGSFDNGEEHPPEYRFDVVLESLQFEGMNEVMFERLLVARESQVRGEPITGELSVEDLQRRAEARAASAEQELASAETRSAESAESWDDAGDAASGFASADAIETQSAPLEPITSEVDVGDVEDVDRDDPRAAAPRAAPAAAPSRGERAAAAAPSPPREIGKLPSPHSFNGQALTRPSLPSAWTPEPMPRPDAAQSSGLFDYQGGVPRPASPPRPAIDPSYRVQGAPRPGAPWPRRGIEQQQPQHDVHDGGDVADGADSGFEDVGGEDPLHGASGGSEQEW